MVAAQVLLADQPEAAHDLADRLHGGLLSSANNLLVHAKVGPGGIGDHGARHRLPGRLPACAFPELRRPEVSSQAFELAAMRKFLATKTKTLLCKPVS